MFKNVKSSLVIRNLKTGSISILNIPIHPHRKPVDIFSVKPNMSESLILDALKPGGEIHSKVASRQIEIVSCRLFGLENSIVNAKNLKVKGSADSLKFLSTNNDGELVWSFVDAASKLDVQSPLTKEGNELGIQKASGLSNGYLSKDDWLLFKGKSTGFRIWQYQDFDVTDNVLKISAFENGENFPFDAGYIVDGSAMIVSLSNLESAPSTKGKWASMFGAGEDIVVEQHVGDQILLSDEVGTKSRVYFLVSLPVSTDIPQDYKEPPRIVREARIEYIDALDMDYGGSKNVRGNKLFEDHVEVKKGLRVENDSEVNGLLSVERIKIKNDAASYHTLMSNGVGDSRWSTSPIVSSHPPADAYPGQVWVKSPDFEMYVNDTERGKWLGTSSFKVSGGLNSTAASNTYLKGLDNVSMGINAEVLPFDATLVFLSAGGETKQHWKAEVHVNGIMVEEALIHVVNSDHAYVNRLNVDFSAGDKVQLFISGDKVSMPKTTAVFKRRFV